MIFLHRVSVRGGGGGARGKTEKNDQNKVEKDKKENSNQREKKEKEVEGGSDYQPLWTSSSRNAETLQMKSALEDDKPFLFFG